MQRRTFLSSIPTIVAGFSCTKSLFGNITPETSDFSITDPVQGAVLHQRLKEPVIGVVNNPVNSSELLKIKVRGIAPPDFAVDINAVAAKRTGNTFEAEILLNPGENEITATLNRQGTLQKSAIKVWWLHNSFPRYRFTIDDTVYCLREIHRKQYKSLFDDYFLGNIRHLHKKYGTKVALNIFYESEDGFNLSQFSDKYKSEWQDNADWLRLLFHAKSEFPSAPYQNAPTEQLLADIRLVEHEIKRFAGEETFLPPTVIHFGEVLPETHRPLAEYGSTVFSGYFRGNGDYRVSYQVDSKRCDYLSQHDFLVDLDSGLVFSKIDIVANLVPLDEIIPTLEAVVANPDTAEFLDFLTHEQYFWPFYFNYLPDHWDRLDRMFRFATDRGYKPVFINDPWLGIP